MTELIPLFSGSAETQADSAILLVNSSGNSEHPFFKTDSYG